MGLKVGSKSNILNIRTYCEVETKKRKPHRSPLCFFRSQLVRQRRFELPCPLQALPPQSSASTSFAIAATIKWCAKINKLLLPRNAAFYRLKIILNVVPLSTSLCFTKIEPWWYFSITRRASDSPNPQPRFLVVNPGVNIFFTW